MEAAYNFLKTVCKNTKYLFRLTGYARSGQHAISNWLLAQAPETSLWVNNIQHCGIDINFQHYWYGPIPVDLKEIQLTGLGFEGDLYKMQKTYPEIPTILVIRDIFNQTASVAKHPELKVNSGYFRDWNKMLSKHSIN